MCQLCQLAKIANRRIQAKQASSVLSSWGSLLPSSSQSVFSKQSQSLPKSVEKK